MKISKLLKCQTPGLADIKVIYVNAVSLGRICIGSKPADRRTGHIDCALAYFHFKLFLQNIQIYRFFYYLCNLKKRMRL